MTVAAVSEIDLTRRDGVGTGPPLSRRPILVMGDESSRDRVLRILDSHPSISRVTGSHLLPYLARVAGNSQVHLGADPQAEPLWRTRVAGFFSSSQAAYATRAGKARWATEVPGHEVDEVCAFFPDALVLHALGSGRPSPEVQAARRAGSRMGPRRYLEVSHADLVAQPAKAARCVLEFVGESTETVRAETPERPTPPALAAAADPMLRQAALTDLAHTALLGVRSAALFEEAARVVQVTLDAGTCDLYEFLPGGGELVITATALGTERPRDAIPPGAALVIPIGTSRPFGCLALLAREGRRFSPDDRQFAVQVADILAAALQRLSVEEDRRLVALHDPLTGLPNRALILDHLRLALARSQRRPGGVGVLFVDLDGFKAINDTMGHQAGDAVLVAVGQRLRAALRPPDTVGRFGGDEFVVICEDIGGEADALGVAERLNAALAAPVRVAGRDVVIGASIGVAVAVSHAADPDALIAEADGAMFCAKRPGRTVSLLDEQLRIGIGGVLVERLVGLLDEIEEPDHFDLEAVS